MTPDELRRLHDEHDAIRHGLEQPFWALLDRELAKREQTALNAILKATDATAIAIAAGEFNAVRTLRQLPASLRESLRATIENDRLPRG